MISKKKILIIPGLNQSREIYSAFFCNKNINVSFFEFPCNKNNLEDFKSIPIEEYISPLSLFLEKNTFDCIICSSLGALVFTKLLNNFESEKVYKYTKIIMLGPAFSFRIGEGLIKLLPGWLFIPSFNKREFRIFNGCYIRNYKDLFRLSKKIDLIALKKLECLEVFIDENDELVDYKNLNIENLRLIRAKTRPRHLYLDLINDLAKEY